MKSGTRKGLTITMAATAATLIFAASPATDAFTVTATVEPSCSVLANDMNFGTYSAASTKDATSTIDVNCTIGTDYNVSLSVGAGSGADYATGRKMTGLTENNETLTYNLYRESGHTEVWGDGTGATYINSGTGDGLLNADHYTVYGLIPAGQDVPPQTYQDTVQVTVTY